MSVGDVNSKKVGSGARYNDGKPDFSLMLLRDMPLMDLDYCLHEAITHLAEFQLTGSRSALDMAHWFMYEYAISVKSEEDEYAFAPVVRVWEFGKRKYDTFNWMKGMAWSIPFACIMRHLLKIIEVGETIDPDSGEPHWACVVCNIQMLIHYTYSYEEGNDLPIDNYEK